MLRSYKRFKRSISIMHIYIYIWACVLLYFSYILYILRYTIPNIVYTVTVFATKVAVRWRKTLRSLHNTRSDVLLVFYTQQSFVGVFIRDFYARGNCAFGTRQTDVTVFFAGINENKQKKTNARLYVFKLADLYSEFVYLWHTFQMLTLAPPITYSPK